MTGYRRIGLKIEPLDVLFFRDGRPFELGMRAIGGLPTPQTLAGALRTHMWRALEIDFSKMKEALEASNNEVSAAARMLLGEKNAWAAGITICGPFLWSDGSVKCKSSDEKERKVPIGPLMPAPADLVRLGKKNEDGPVIRLRPRKKLPGGINALPEGMLPLWHQEKDTVDKVSGFLTSEGLKVYLDGETPDRKMVLKESDLLVWEDRTGIGVDVKKNSAEDGKLYSARFLRLKSGVSFYAEIEIPASSPEDAAKQISGIITWGGEGRRVSVGTVEKTFDWPAPKNKGDGDLALLVSPGIFMAEPNWKPDGIGAVNLISAAVPGSVAISGWNLANNRPKPVRHAVTTGSVYLSSAFNCKKQGAFMRLGKDNEFAAQGFGLALKGVWNNER